MAIEHGDGETQTTKRPRAKAKRQSHRLGRGSFGKRTTTPRVKAKRAGATTVASTPLRIYVAGVRLDATEKEKARTQLGRALWRFGGDITQAHVRFTDINGPRGGVDTMCRVKLSVAGIDHILVEARAVDAASALRRAIVSAKNALVRAMERRGRTAKRVEVPQSGVERRSPAKTGASDRKAGSGAATPRNVRLRTRRATVTLEASAKDRPTRKSTRKSANRQKAASQIARTEKRAHHKPSARARRSSATSRSKSASSSR